MNNVKPVQLMVVGAHPDDAEFGIAGTVARWVQEGKVVVYVVCTSGDKGTSDPDVKPEELAKVREEEQHCAARVLGVSEVEFLRFPDQGLEDTPDFRKEIVRMIRQYRPETLATADPYRRYIWHRDHRIAAQSALDAVYPYARDYHAYPDLIKEGFMPHKVKEMLLWGSEDPNFCVDITGTFDIKMKALRCHKSQFKEEDLPEMEQWLRQRCEQMAEGKDFKLAENFHREEVWQ